MPILFLQTLCEGPKESRAVRVPLCQHEKTNDQEKHAPVAQTLYQEARTLLLLLLLLLLFTKYVFRMYECKYIAMLCKGPGLRATVEKERERGRHTFFLSWRLFIAGSDAFGDTEPSAASGCDAAFSWRCFCFVLATWLAVSLRQALRVSWGSVGFSVCWSALHLPFYESSPPQLAP